MDLTALQDRLKYRFRDQNCDIHNNAAWTDYINDALRDVEAATELWPFLYASDTVTVNAGSRSVDLPTDALKVTSAFNSTDGWKLQPMEGATGPVREWPDQDETGPPLHYRIYGNELQLFPVPTANTSVAVEYKASITPLSAGDDVPPFPERYHHMLVEGALARAYLDDGNQNQAQYHQEQFNGILSRMLSDLVSGQQERYPEIQDTWFD